MGPAIRTVMVGRRVGLLLEHAAFTSLWVVVALSNRPPIENHGPWFDAGGIVLGAVAAVGAVGVGAGLVESTCQRRRSLRSAWAAAVLIAIYTLVAFTTAFAAVSFRTSFNDNSPVARGEWNGAWIYFGVLMAIPAVVAEIATALSPVE